MTSYIDTGLDCNRDYHYWVRAYRSDMDIVSAARKSGEIAWWENDGQQSFTKRTVATGFGGAYSVHAADVDGDYGSTSWAPQPMTKRLPGGRDRSSSSRRTP